MEASDNSFVPPPLSISISISFIFFLLLFLFPNANLRLSVTVYITRPDANDANDDGLKCSLFHRKEALLPDSARIGDIVRLNRVGVSVLRLCDDATCL